MSDLDNERIGDAPSRGLKIYLAAGIGVLFVVVHISMRLTSYLHHVLHPGYSPWVRGTARRVVQRRHRAVVGYPTLNHG
jgi:hypothetical protein